MDDLHEKLFAKGLDQGFRSECKKTLEDEITILRGLLNAYYEGELVYRDYKSKESEDLRTVMGCAMEGQCYDPLADALTRAIEDRSNRLKSY